MSSKTHSGEHKKTAHKNYARFFSASQSELAEVHTFMVPTVYSAILSTAILTDELLHFTAQQKEVESYSAVTTFPLYASFSFAYTTRLWLYRWEPWL